MDGMVHGPRGEGGGLASKMYMFGIFFYLSYLFWNYIYLNIYDFLVGFL